MKTKESKICPIKETLVYSWVCEEECDYKDRCNDIKWVKKHKARMNTPTMDYVASEKYRQT